MRRITATTSGGRRRLAGVLVLGAGLGALALQLDRGASDPGPKDASAPTSDAPTTEPPPTSASTTAATATTPPLDPVDVAPTDRFAAAAGRSDVVGTGPVRTYVVEVEVGIPVDPDTFAAAVDATLADRRGWTAGGDVALQRVGPAHGPSFRVRLATPATVDQHCAPLRTNGIYSCRQGAEVLINLLRWQEGAAPSQLSVEDYRHYVISHEVGHALGHGHVACPGPGQPAPVMLQQTKGLDGCAPNPWPYPDG